MRLSQRHSQELLGNDVYTLGSSTEAIIDLLMQYAINRVLLTS